MRDDPAAANQIVGEALKLDNETVSGMLSGLKLTAYADNAQFYGLGGGKAHYDTLFDTAFTIWRKKGLVTRAVDAKDWVDTRFLQSLSNEYASQEVVEEPAVKAKAPGAKKIAPSSTNKFRFTSRRAPDQIMDRLATSCSMRSARPWSRSATLICASKATPMRPATPKANFTLSDKARERGEEISSSKQFPSIQAARFQTIGNGSKAPVAPNSTEAGRQLNRRTDIKVVLATQ